MDVFAQQKKTRFAFLQRLWELTGGNTNASVGAQDIGQELGLSVEETRLTVSCLGDEGLLRRAGGETATRRARQRPSRSCPA